MGGRLPADPADSGHRERLANGRGLVGEQLYTGGPRQPSAPFEISLDERSFPAGILGVRREGSLIIRWRPPTLRAKVRRLGGGCVLLDSPRFSTTEVSQAP